MVAGGGKLRKNTVKTYRYVIEGHAIPYFGNIDMKTLKPIMYQKFINGKIESGLSNETAGRIHYVISLQTDCTQRLSRKESV
ncbi:N-terminal phage integrase SAM-like domain-containing protein [Bacillus sp. FSL K6-3431]|uniref:N-terminal phage integrase SAM-like domain-containing protein n=1 Tax=Bacillus sp. FSL K6-3431 TaxID=2921500 RepID=UPI0030FB4407